MKDKIEIRKSDWDLIIRQTTDQLKAQLIHVELTKAVIAEAKRQKKCAVGNGDPIDEIIADEPVAIV